MITMTVDQQLQKLRTDYRQARQDNNIEKMKLCERLAHRLKNPPEAYFSHSVKESLGMNQPQTNNVTQTWK